MMLLPQSQYKSKLITIPNLVLALYLATGVIKYILGTEVFRDRYFYIASGIIFVSYVFFAPLPHKKYIQLLAITLLIGSILTILNVGSQAFLYYGGTLVQLGVAGFIFKYRYRISEKVPEYGLYLFTMYVLILYAKYGNFEHHFGHAGRNAVSWISLAFCALYYILIFMQGRLPTNFIPPTIGFIICLVAQGRAGIITSFLFFVSSFWYCTRKFKSNYKMWITSAIVLIGIAVYAYNHMDFFDQKLDYFREKRFTGAARSGIVQDYTNELNAQTLVTGVNPVQIGLAAELSTNPHNSYIIGHVRYGIMIVVFYVLLLYSLAKGFFNKHIRYIMMILFILSLRMLTDTVVFIYPFDFIVYVLIIALLCEPRKLEYEGEFEDEMAWQLPIH